MDASDRPYHVRPQPLPPREPRDYRRENSATCFDIAVRLRRYRISIATHNAGPHDDEALHLLNRLERWWLVRGMLWHREMGGPPTDEMWLLYNKHLKEADTCNLYDVWPRSVVMDIYWCPDCDRHHVTWRWKRGPEHVAKSFGIHELDRTRNMAYDERQPPSCEWVHEVLDTLSCMALSPDWWDLFTWCDGQHDPDSPPYTTPTSRGVGGPDVLAPEGAPPSPPPSAPASGDDAPPPPVAPPLPIAPPTQNHRSATAARRACASRALRSTGPAPMGTG